MKAVQSQITAFHGSPGAHEGMPRPSSACRPKGLRGSQVGCHSAVVGKLLGLLFRVVIRDSNTSMSRLSLEPAGTHISMAYIALLSGSRSRHPVKSLEGSVANASKAAALAGAEGRPPVASALLSV